MTDIREDEDSDVVADALAALKPASGARVVHIGDPGHPAVAALGAGGATVEVLAPSGAAAALAAGAYDVVHLETRDTIPPEEGVALAAALGAAPKPGGDVLARWPVNPEGPTLDALFEAFCAREDIEVDEADVDEAPDGHVALIVAHVRGADAPVAARRPFPQRAGLLEVVEVIALTPGMRRLVFTGAALASLRIDEPGEIITLIWPAEGAEVVLPEEGRWRFPDDAPEQHCRNYTVRAFDRGAFRITIDFFLHEEPGAAGDWAATAQVGDVIGFGGTRTHWITDPTATWSLLVSDETGLPALAAIAESRPPGHRVLAVVEVADEREVPALPTGDGVEVHPVYRRDRAPGVDSGLPAALASLDIPEGRGQVFAAAETHVVADLRTHLLRERGVPRDALAASGYWHRDHDHD